MDPLMRILIIKTSALGDIIHTFPSLSHLRECFPEAEIDWVVENSFAELVAANHEVNHVFTIESRKWRSSWWKKETREAIKSFREKLQKKEYDLVIDFQGNIKSGLVCWCARGKRKIGFDRKNAAEIPNLLFTTEKVTIPPHKNIREDYLALAAYATGKSAELKDKKLVLRAENPLPLDGKGWVLVCPGARWINKQLTEQTLQSFLERLHQQHQMCFLLAWGSEHEHEIAKNIQARMPSHTQILPRLPLPELQQLMGQVEMVIAMDSLPLHLAATTGTPTFSFFGPSAGEKYAPIGKNHHHFQGGCPYGQHFEKRCPILRSCKTGACLREVDVEELVAAFNKIERIYKV